MDKSLLIQKQIKDNAEDLQSYVRDLKLWEEEMKRKDRQLSKEPTEEALPPVRRPKLSNKPPDKKEESIKTKKKIASFDYSSWDKFDVEKAFEEIDKEDEESSNDEEQTAQEEKFLKEKALYEKELGNKHVKASKWEEAIECYTNAIKAYPKDPVFFANRALCYLKKKKYEMVESDCTASLKLDPTYVKAMLRRAAAREALGRMEDSRLDLRNALKLEPNNQQAMKDLERLKDLSDKKKTLPSSRILTPTKSEESISQCKINILEKTESSSNIQPAEENKDTKDQNHLKKLSEECFAEPEWEPCSNIIEPIVKPPHMRSKKSLKRIEIHDVGPNLPQHVCPRKTLKSQTTSMSTSNQIPLTTTQNPSQSETTQIMKHSADTKREGETNTSTSSAAKPRSILTVATTTQDIPPPPSTSVQFHKAWSSIKSNPEMCYRFLKQIPGETLPDIFKESLESRMFSSILETLASEFPSRQEPVLSYLRGVTRVKRFSALALFMSAQDKSNLNALFQYGLSSGECSSKEVEELRRLFEM